MTRNEINCWIITEGLAGTENQCVGVAQALGITPKILKISLNKPWKTLSPYLGFEQAYTFTPRLAPPWPDLLITSGRKAIAASRYIKKMSKGHTKTLHIQDPRISSRHFDLVSVPAHDPLRGKNVIVTTAAPNKITQELLDKAKLDFSAFREMQSPRIAVLIGGNSKAYTLTESITENLAERLNALEGSLMITCSRRTGEGNKAILETKLNHAPNYMWGGSGSNPYLALLAWADFILVTADSVSMLSESCTTGKPVYMIDLEGGAKRISTLHKNLIDKGALRVFNGSLENYNYEPLNDADFIANEVKKRFNLFTD